MGEFFLGGVGGLKFVFSHYVISEQPRMVYLCISFSTSKSIPKKPFQVKNKNNVNNFWKIPTFNYDVSPSE